MSPSLKASIPACASAILCSLLAAIQLQDREERLLRNLDGADLLHPLLALLLLLEQLALPGYVSPVELRGHVLAEGLDGLARDHDGADRGLHRHVEELPWDRVLQPLDQGTPAVVGELPVHDQREGVDPIAGEQDVELDQIGGAIADRLVVERCVAAAPRLELVEEVEHDLRERQVVPD